MDQELIDSFGNISKIPDTKMKQFSNSNFIVQYLNTTLEMGPTEFKKLVNNDSEFNNLNRLLESLEENEYVIAAYFDGKVVGAKKKIHI